MLVMNNESVIRLRLARRAARSAEIHQARAHNGVKRFRSMSERELRQDLGWAKHIQDLCEALETATENLETKVPKGWDFVTT